MRRPRFKTDGEGFYHVVSRIGGRRFLMDDAEKRILLGMVRAAAEFSGVEVYTYALMDNHFHLLIRVPRREEVDDAELERRMQALYGPAQSTRLLGQWAKWTATGNKTRVEDAKRRLLARMYDLSQFIKTFKESYTQDYNRRHDNTGTIWEGRFKSILLEGTCRALMAVAAYIHLNPIRAKMVENPELAPFTGYGAACAGDEKAKQGLLALVIRALYSEPSGQNWAAVRKICRDAMDGTLGKPPETLAVTNPYVQTTPNTPNNGNRQGKKQCPLRELLRQRCLGFLHGGALGGAAFLQTQANLLPPRLHQRSRTMLDNCRELGLTVLFGIRKVS